MGVHGITTLLKERGWLGPASNNECCSARLWKEWNPVEALLGNEDGGPSSSSQRRIPPQSLFLIDGNGLAFYLHQVAYARHIRNVGNTTTTTTTICCPLTNSLNPKQITQVLPCLLPLHLLKEATMEFVSTLRKHNIRMQVFWDGRARRFKALTNQKRKQRRQEEWGTLQQYCFHGSMPKERNTCQWGCHFPFSSMFLKCVRNALHVAFVNMVDCPEEADGELARRASGDPSAYVIGQDSDFFFYKDIQYIPLDSICTSQSSLHAVVGTRVEIAEFLGLEDDQMVEFAILKGNDYVDLSTLKTPIMRDPQSIIAYLQDQDDGYQVDASEQAGRSLEYVRCLYNLENLDSLPLDGTGRQPDTNNNSDTSITSEDDKIMREIQRVISFPGDFPNDQATVFPDDNSVRDAVIRCLQTYIDQSLYTDNEASCLALKQIHLDAYKASTMPSAFPIPLEHRPRWTDIRAAYVIETCISRILQSSRQSFLARGTAPDTLLNHIQFQAVLFSLQGPDFKDDPALADGDSPEVGNTPASPSVERVQLPIDEHESKILETIQNNRVTIIHGETGCGKSSRVPIMLLNSPPPIPSMQVKFFMSQPRRIAAKALVERVRSCEPEHGHKFALRMGHGWREYESNRTQAWFVTTGYLTRLLANHPDRFDDCTHLIIDEVHERSVDTDILCLLCRRLLKNNQKIRLVLMSATLATKLYQDYFQVPNEPIHVGVRKFPIQEFFVEDLAQFGLPPKEAKDALAIQKECESKRCNSAPSQPELSKRFALAARLTTIVGEPGSSVLIFVPGMNEIVSITECIESYYVAGITYTTYPIHSDIPFEDQMSAFDSPAKDEVKVIIATNAAESSVTLPNVDHVICLGLCRQIMYNQSSHRQVLTPCWISRASATQRAGRTGRVRPGNVYRLYTRHAYESYMEEFEPGEMVRIPLDAVILMLKQMLHEEVKPVLLDCIEPPPLDTIDRSFQSLHRWNFITEPADEADITTLGSFVSSLGIDLSLGSLIGIGIQFGVAAEAIEMAAVMSFPKTPFQIANPLFQDAAKYNEILCQGYISKSHFDSNLYSEPMALMNALWDYEMVSNKQKWCFYYRFAMSRLKQLVSTRNSLRKRVAEFLGIDETRLQVENPPVHMPDAKITLLRLLQVWVFSDTLIESHPTKIKVSSNGDVSISLKGNVNKLKESHLCQVLDPERHPHKIISCRDIMQSGDFCYEETLDLDQYMNSFEKRLISYMSETNTDLACCYDRNHFFLFVMDEHTNGDGIASLLESVSSDATESLLLANQYSDIKRRGILERRCGMWAVLDFTGFGDLLNETTREQKRFRKIHVNDSRNVDFVSLCDAANQALVGGEVNSIMFWDFSSSVTGKKKKKKQQERQKFSVILRGECNQIAKQDMQDLLGKDTSTIRIRSDTDTSISFQNSPNQPFPYDGKDANKLAVSCITDSSSWNRSFFQDIPEGARVLSVMASGLRRGRHRLRFVPVEASENLTNDPDATLDFGLKNEETDLNKRWRRLGTDSVVFVQVDTVPASATHSSLSLFACCSNALEIRGGGLKVEGLTLLPPNPLFLLLSLLSFGIEPGVSFNWDHKEQDDGEAKKFQNAIRWLRDRKIFSETFQDEEVNAKHRIKMAFSFHESCAEMGEELVCFPEKIDALCTLFDSVDNRLSPWESLEERALTAENLKLWRLEKKILHKEKKTIISMGNRNAIQPKRQLDGGGNTKGLPNGNGGRIKHDTEIAIGRVRKENDRDTSKATLTQSRKENKNQYEPKAVPKWQTLRTFTDETITQSRGWFATELQNGEQLPPTDFPSTNILSLLFQLYSDQILAFESLQKENKRYVSLNSENWEILSYKSENEIFYHARFTNDSIPIVPIIGRGKNKLSKWMKKHMRPNRIDDAKACVPPGVFIPTPYSGPILKDRPTLVFDSIGSALKMEAAFWLERQFCYAGKSTTRHWYDHNFQEMILLLQKNHANSQAIAESS